MECKNKEVQELKQEFDELVSNMFQPATNNERRINFRDFHEQRKGSTFYADLKKEVVTMGGMNFDSSEMWLSKGNVAWTEDTAHCRISIGFDVEDAKRIARESLGHHQVIVYGDYMKSIQMMCNFINLNIKNI